MYQRLTALSDKLAYYGLPFQSGSEQMLRRLSASADPASLQVLASVVQPPRDYAREKLKTYDAFVPLNRLVDTVPPESETARVFNQLAERIATGKAAPGDWDKACQWLTLWRDNDAALQPSLTKSELTAELAPVSQNLARTAAIGLLALDSLQKNRPLNAETQKQEISELKELEKPQAVLLDKIVPGVELLVQAARKR